MALIVVYPRTLLSVVLNCELCTRIERSATDQVKPAVVMIHSRQTCNIPIPADPEAQSPLHTKSLFNERAQSPVIECSWLECLLRRRPARPGRIQHVTLRLRDRPESESVDFPG